MKQRFVAAMDLVHSVCMVVAGITLIVITLIIPWGVFTRYVLGVGSSWPEPMAVLLMIWFSFLSAAVCYREGLHIGVQIFANRLTGAPRLAVGWAIVIAMAATNLFMLVWGTKLVMTTWHQAIAEFQIVTAGMSYLPVPLGGAIVTLFVIERLWTGDLFHRADEDSLTHASTE